VKSILLAIVVLSGAAACGKKSDAPGPAPTASGSAASGTAATPPAAAGSGSAAAPPTATGSGTAATPPAATPRTCADGDAAACVAEANKIAPQGAYRAELSKEDADAKEAATVKLAARACELGNGEGCMLLARYDRFSDSDKNLERACELGYVPSCGSVGRGLADGGKKADRARAAALLEQACDADVMDWMALTAHHGGFCRQLQELYARTKNKAKEASAHERACKQGDKLGCPCKTAADCGAVPDDQSGDYDCFDDKCDITGG
jgi:hypothetical protein